jgi:hypothetical protein
MEGNMKKQVLVAVGVGCLIVAAAVFYFTNSTSSSSGVPAEFAGEKILVMCTDKDCGVTYEMDKKAYFEFIEANAVGMQTPPLKCQKCSKNTVFRAEKCERCGEIFLYGNPTDFADRCPKCNFSKIEEERKAAAEK